MLMWCICHKISCAKRTQLSNTQISDTLTENSAQRTEFVRTAWSDTSYIFVYEARKIFFWEILDREYTMFSEILNLLFHAEILPDFPESRPHERNRKA
ncbi:hypothetical protein X798_03257 [Onchocerca flexuosa]|uniref:Uncharacterized protein n=1 Tax=Onchocerca flexuosa TaxID=387005 RepID=A0A238BXS2_9BILA|nr:hypothetical protein X798_03257 [Onchocerca flexuosa]